MAETHGRLRILAAAFVTVTVASSVLCHPGNGRRSNEPSDPGLEQKHQQAAQLRANVRSASSWAHRRNNEPLNPRAEHLLQQAAQILSNSRSASGLAYRRNNEPLDPRAEHLLQQAAQILTNVRSASSLAQLRDNEPLDPQVEKLLHLFAAYGVRAARSLAQLRDNEPLDPQVEKLLHLFAAYGVRAASGLAQLRDNEPLDPQVEKLLHLFAAYGVRAASSSAQLRNNESFDPRVQEVLHLFAKYGVRSASQMGQLRNNESLDPRVQEVLHLFAKYGVRAASQLAHARNNEDVRIVTYEGTIGTEPQMWIFVPKAWAPGKQNQRISSSLTKGEEGSSDVVPTPSRSENDTVIEDLRDAPAKSSREEISTVEGDTQTKNDTDVVDVANRGLFGLRTAAHLALPNIRAAGGSFHLGISTQGEAKTKVSARKEQHVGGKIETGTAETIGGSSSFVRVSAAKRVESGPLLGDASIKLGTAAKKEETSVDKGSQVAVELGVGHQTELSGQADGKLAIHLEREDDMGSKDEGGELVVNVEKGVHPELKAAGSELQADLGLKAGKIGTLAINMDQAVEKDGEAADVDKEEKIVVNVDQKGGAELEKKDDGRLLEREQGTNAELLISLSNEGAKMKIEDDTKLSVGRDKVEAANVGASEKLSVNVAQDTDLEGKGEKLEIEWTDAALKSGETIVNTTKEADLEEDGKTREIEINLENDSSSPFSTNESKKLEINLSVDGDSRTRNVSEKLAMDVELDQEGGTRNGNEEVILWSGSGATQAENNYKEQDGSALEGSASMKKELTANGDKTNDSEATIEGKKVRTGLENGKEGSLGKLSGNVMVNVDRKEKSSSKSVRTKVRSSSSTRSSKVNLGLKHEDAISFGKLRQGVSTMRSKKTESKKESSNVSGLLFLELDKTVGVKLKNGGSKMNVELESGDASSESNSGRNVNVALEHGEELDLGDLRGRLKVDLEGLSDLGSDHAGELVKVERNGGKVDIELKRGDEVRLGGLRGKLNVNLGGGLEVGSIGRRMHVETEKEGESATEDESKVTRTRAGKEKVSDMLDGVMDYGGRQKTVKGTDDALKLGAPGTDEGRKQSPKVKGPKRKGSGKRKSKRRRGKSHAGSSKTGEQGEKTGTEEQAMRHGGDSGAKLVEPGTTTTSPKQPDDQHFDGWSEAPELEQERDLVGDQSEATDFATESDAKVTLEPNHEASPSLALDFDPAMEPEVAAANLDHDGGFGMDYYDEAYEDSPLPDNDESTEDSNGEGRVEDLDDRVEVREARVEDPEGRVEVPEGRAADSSVEVQETDNFGGSSEMGEVGDLQREDATM